MVAEAITRFIIFLVFVAFLDLIIFTYLHELAHKRALKKAGIRGTIKWNFRENLKYLKARALATCYFDENKLKKAGYEKKKEIFLAGIKMDLKILLILSVLSIVIWFLLVMNTRVILVYYMLIIINVLVLLRVWSLINNVSKKDSDIDKFFIIKK